MKTLTNETLKNVEKVIKFVNNKEYAYYINLNENNEFFDLYDKKTNKLIANKWVSFEDKYLKSNDYKISLHNHFMKCYEWYKNRWVTRISKN